MRYFDWNEDKNRWLKAERGISFEDIQAAIQSGGILDDIPHPKPRYRHQRVYIIKLEEYAYLVPYVTDGDKVFLKTIIPNREATQHYLHSRERGA